MNENKKCTRGGHFTESAFYFCVNNEVYLWQHTLKQYKLINVIYKVMADKLSVLRNVIMKPFYCHNRIIMGFRTALLQIIYTHHDTYDSNSRARLYSLQTEYLDK